MKMNKQNLPKIGFIGLGNMGQPMSHNLVKAGYPLMVFDNASTLTLDVADETGAQAAESLEMLASFSDVIITMLPTGAIVEQVVSEMREHLQENSTIVDMGSSEPLGTIKLGKTLASGGITFLDAPVSGGVTKAKSGNLAIIAGGSAVDLSKVQAILDTMGNVIHTGPLGSGHALKALNNFVSAAGLTAACEALIVAEEFGIEPDIVVDVLNNSSGQNNSTKSKLRQFILNSSFGSGFSAALMAKDIGIASKLAKELDTSHPLLESINQLWSEAAQDLEQGADHTKIFKFLKK